jgi:hypothetical protein
LDFGLDESEARSGEMSGTFSRSRGAKSGKAEIAAGQSLLLVPSESILKER